MEVGNILGDLDFIHDCSVYGVGIPGTDGKAGMASIVLQPGAKPTPGKIESLRSCVLYYETEIIATPPTNVVTQLGCPRGQPCTAD